MCVGGGGGSFSHLPVGNSTTKNNHSYFSDVCVWGGGGWGGQGEC